MSAEELDALIERNWRERVAPTDVVWHLGDIGANWRRLETLPGIKHLVLAHASDRKAAIRNSGIFASIQDSAVLDYAGRAFFLIHNPDQPREGPLRGVIHGHHHYDAPEIGCISVCVDHLDWAPAEIENLIPRYMAPAQLLEAD
jgi:calcineurin-like phosphoesterase family protein